MHPRCCKLSNPTSLPQIIPIYDKVVDTDLICTQVKNEKSSIDKANYSKMFEIENNEKVRKTDKSDKMNSFTAVFDTNVINNFSNTLNSLPSNIEIPSNRSVKNSTYDSNNKTKLYDIEFYPNKIQEKKLNTRAVVTNIEKTLLNLLNKTITESLNDSHIKSNNSYNKITEGSNININNTKISINDIKMSKNFISDSYSISETTNTQIFNNLTPILANSVNSTHDKLFPCENLDKKIFDNSKEIYEDITRKNNNNLIIESIKDPTEFNDIYDSKYNNNDKLKKGKDLIKDIGIKKIINKRKYLSSHSNHHLKRKRNSSSRSLSKESRYSLKKTTRKKTKKQKRSNSNSIRSKSKSLEKILIGKFKKEGKNLLKKENYKKEGEFYKKFLQRLKNKLPLENIDKCLNKGKYCN